MDYKQVLKVASAKQGAIKEKTFSSSVLLKDLGPPKKQEKLTKGVNSPGVRAFLENLDKPSNKRQTTSRASNGTTEKKPASSPLGSDELDINHLFRKDRRVARLPDEAIPDMLALSKMRKHILQEKEETKQTEIRVREEKERVEREKQRIKNQAVKRALDILQKNSSNKDEKPSIGMKRQHSVERNHQEVKKPRLNNGVSSSTRSFKIPRKGVTGSKSIASGPPPMKFEDLLKVAEKNNQEQPSEDVVREILLGSTKPKKKDAVVQEEKDKFKKDKNPSATRSSSVAEGSSKDVKYKSLPTSSHVSNSKTNTLKTNSSNSYSTKHPGTSMQTPSCSSNGTFKKPLPTSGNVSKKNVVNTMNNKIMKSDNNRPSTTNKLLTNGSRPVSNNKIVPNNRPVASTQKSDLPKNCSPTDLKVLERMAESLKGVSDAMRNDVLSILNKYKSQKMPPPSSNPNGNKVAGNNPITHKRPDMNGKLIGLVTKSSNVPSKLPENKSVANGWDRAMSALIPKSNKQIKREKQLAKRRDDDDYLDDGEEDEYNEDDNMSDFIDDSGEDLDYSSHIKQIFNYDKSRYIDDDDDLSGMESSFSQIQKEETVSSKIGLMEDLEDMRLEQEELQRKKEKKIGRR